MLTGIVIHNCRRACPTLACCPIHFRPLQGDLAYQCLPTCGEGINLPKESTTHSLNEFFVLSMERASCLPKQPAYQYQPASPIRRTMLYICPRHHLLGQNPASCFTPVVLTGTRDTLNQGCGFVVSGCFFISRMVCWISTCRWRRWWR